MFDVNDPEAVRKAYNEKDRRLGRVELLLLRIVKAFDEQNSEALKATINAARWEVGQ